MIGAIILILLAEAKGRKLGGFVTSKMQSAEALKH